ncbi:MAG: hypothetical protein IKU84_07680 [Clostridia bacterium]|nr:hypothetical protein [Clostridia bacterium]
MNISDMIEFVNKISAFEFSKKSLADSVPMSELREDRVEKSDCTMERQVVVDKVEGV